MELTAIFSASPRRRWVVWAEPVLAAMAAPLLLFPRGPLPLAGVGLLLVGWTFRGLGSGRWLPRTPLDRPILILLLMTFASLYPSGSLALSVPKFYGIVLGFFAYYATEGSVSSRRDFWCVVGLLVGSVAAVSSVGLVGTDWSEGKYPVLQRFYNWVPRLIDGVQTSVGTSEGFHPNEIGGTLAFLLPVPLALMLCPSIGFVRRAVLSLVVLCGLGVLVLSVSRSAFVGLAVGMLALLVWRWRGFGLGLLGVAAMALALSVGLNGPVVADFLLRIDATSMVSDTGSLPGRLEIWDRAGRMIEDFPFTGIGLNTFPVVLDTLYPSVIAGPDARLPHAHNIYLQTAVDLGLGGLLAFLGLWAAVAMAGWRSYRHCEGVRSAPPPTPGARRLSGQPSREEKVPAAAVAASRARPDRRPTSIQAALVGLLVGTLSYLVFGLTDAITLGAKPWVLLWMMMGLVVAARRVETSQQPVSPPDACTRVLQRLLAAALGTVFNLYWMFVYFLVLLAYLVVGLGISRWTL